MNYSHYTDIAVALAADLANDLDGAWSPSQVVEFVAARGVDEAGRVTRSDLMELVQLRDRLRKVFEAGAADDVPRVAQALNRLIVEADVRPELTDHDGTWHLHFAPPGAKVAARLAAATAMGLATVIAEDGVRRIKACAAESCDRVFVDLSRNVSRRYCGDRCANRENVAAFRARHRTG